MGQLDIFDVIDQQRRTGRPFCVATVVRTADVTSAKAGAKAVITETGEIIGHLGGACVKRAVTSAVSEAIASGETRLIRVKPSDKVVSLTDTDGAQLYKSGCPSGGTVDILIEPFELPPMLVVFGDTPISRAIAAHGALAGYRLALPEGVSSHLEAARFSDNAIADLPLGPRDFVVVATQGNQDGVCLRAALESPAHRVSMVASRRKADTLSAKLVTAGMDAAQVGRLKSPAGLHIHAIDPQEIAISVMAEIIQWRNTDRKTSGGAHEATA
ncbi:XdhC family protein [Donghicola mangrovi]|uniref:XdhC family protein n=1 Tax=Donghicola mangrovi TaxID=2729614 RepID=A0A850QBH9_9RHOB|nr:XdhC family protein [Donghicola mangrovi]NVO23805.1 XdhC family protein [Donghicola mangrovi]